ncbi:YceD family protein [Paenibacillus beijingensis]|uniref:Metal-binding protein n=1 Tax=Paenibacillus beijingensis TaxID=1126833 RepID=A0A0D5NNC8_9BACL|nr:DUF177 domain-containing protein [Paenibacillus beijingensis]AJY76522.1 hypothetical protein VN24_20585 [Paenibacillus beijingensis]
MYLHIQEAISKGLNLSYRQNLDTGELFKDKPDVLSAGPLRVNLEARPEGRSVRVTGELAIDLEMACSRCLDPVKEQVTIPFEEVFVPSSALSGDEDEDEIIVVKEEKVDLIPYIHEYTLLYLPFAPLCGSDCKGICPDCGQNLNERACGCSKDVINPKFAALKDLFDS